MSVEKLKTYLKDQLKNEFVLETNREPKPNELVNMENDIGLQVRVILKVLQNHELRLTALDKK